MCRRKQQQVFRVYGLLCHRSGCLCQKFSNGIRQIYHNFSAPNFAFPHMSTQQRPPALRYLPFLLTGGGRDSLWAGFVGSFWCVPTPLCSPEMRALECVIRAVRPSAYTLSAFRKAVENYRILHYYSDDETVCDPRRHGGGQGRCLTREPPRNPWPCVTIAASDVVDNTPQTSQSRECLNGNRVGTGRRTRAAGCNGEERGKQLTTSWHWTSSVLRGHRPVVLEPPCSPISVAPEGGRGGALGAPALSAGSTTRRLQTAPPRRTAPCCGRCSARSTGRLTCPRLVLKA